MLSIADQLRMFNEIRTRTLQKGRDELREETAEQIEARAAMEAAMVDKLDNLD